MFQKFVYGLLILCCAGNALGGNSLLPGLAPPDSAPAAAPPTGASAPSPILAGLLKLVTALGTLLPSLIDFLKTIMGPNGGILDQVFKLVNIPDILKGVLALPGLLPLLEQLLPVILILLGVLLGPVFPLVLLLLTSLSS